MKDFFKEKHYAVVLDSRAGIIYADEATDVTDEVLKRINTTVALPEAGRVERGARPARPRRRRSRRAAGAADSRRRKSSKPRVHSLPGETRIEGASGKEDGRGAHETAPAAVFLRSRTSRARSAGTVVGDPRLRLTGVESLERAAPTDLSWVADRGCARAGRARAAPARSSSPRKRRPAAARRSSSPNPLAAFAVWLGRSDPPPSRPRAGVSPRAHVDRTARIGRGASVAAGATVAAGRASAPRAVISAGAFVGEDAEIGEDTWLHPNAAVLAGCRVGARCILHAGAVVGSDGFGYVWDGAAHRKIPQRRDRPDRG